MTSHFPPLSDNSLLLLDRGWNLDWTLSLQHLDTMDLPLVYNSFDLFTLPGGEELGTLVVPFWDLELGSGELCYLLKHGAVMSHDRGRNWVSMTQGVNSEPFCSAASPWQ